MNMADADKDLSRMKARVAEHKMREAKKPRRSVKC